LVHQALANAQPAAEQSEASFAVFANSQPAAFEAAGCFCRARKTGAHGRSATGTVPGTV